MIDFDELRPENGHIIAEPACSHEGNYKRLKALIECASNSDAKIIKFQIFTQCERALVGHKEWELFGRLELPESDWKKAIDLARKKNLTIFSDIFGMKSFAIAKKLGVDGYKIHSEDILNSFFIEKVAKEGKILFLSIGGSHRVELFSLLNHLKEKQLLNKTILMTGIQTYPTPIEAHYLNEIPDLIEKYKSYGIKVGFSDHISGDRAESFNIPLMAFAKGAAIVEKHYTINREDKWIDYESSLDKDDFKKFISMVNNLCPLLKPFGLYTDSEASYRKIFKKSAATARDIKKGQTLRPDDIIFQKLTNSATPITSLRITGRKAICDMKAGTQIRERFLRNKVGIIIVARCTSERLPNKALAKVGDKEAIAILISRMKLCKKADCIILATSTDTSDDILVEIAKREGIHYFRGSLTNVAQRYYQAAVKYNLDHLVRVTGDALLCDENMVDKAIDSHLDSSCDVTFMKNMPFGTHKEIVTTKALGTIVEQAQIPSNTEYLEYFLENQRYFSVNYVSSDYKFKPNYRLTLDYKEDLVLIQTIYDYFLKEKGQKHATLEQVLAYLDVNPEVAKINKHKAQKFNLHNTRDFFNNELNVQLKI